ncbi:MAG: HAD-IA family hydrolase [Candidatus Woesearchaeota archaeon]
MKTILVDAIRTLVSEEGVMFEDLYELLESYPNRKIVLTGADDAQMESFGLNDLPYEVFTLRHDPEKSDPRYYELMLERFGLSAGDVVYFEHNEAAVASARSVGITALHYDPKVRDLQALRAFLDEHLGS